MAPATQESRLPVIGEEKQFEVAIRNEKIISTAIENLREVLRLVMVKIGLRSANWPNEMEKAILIKHILENFAGHTCEEIKLAFEMAIAGKLEEFDAKGNAITLDANCYENFSCLYFSKVMNAYRHWARDAHKVIAQSITPIQKVYTDEEILNQRRQEIETAFQAMKKGCVPIIHKYFFGVLKDDNLLLELAQNEGQDVDVETVSDFFVRKLNSNAENIYVKQ